MRTAKVPISFGYQQAAIFMANPRGDHLEIDILLDGVAQEVMAHAVVRERWQGSTFAGLLDGVFRAVDANHDSIRRPVDL
jgi:hypothetical protein